MVRSLGFGPENVAALDDAVKAMCQRGLDVTAHRSRKVTGPRIAEADMILTAERDHVVKIAAISQKAYRRTFTLPEFLNRVSSDPVADGRTLADWMTDLTVDRSAAAYLGGDVPDVWDPTGSSRRRFAEQVDHIALMCGEVVDLLARSFDGSSDRFEF